MNIYHLHLRSSLSELRDEEGHGYPSLEALRQGVLLAARDLIAADVLKGHVDFGQWIDAEDANGRVIHALQFRDAVTMANLV